MFFRTSFLFATFACVLTIIFQCSSVHASPAPGIRPMLHAFDVEPSNDIFSSAASTASADATISAVAVIDAAASSSTSESAASSTPIISGDTPQTNSAIASSSGISAALLISAIAVTVQFI